MPTYDYRCPNGHDFERFVRRFSEAETELVCPVCGAVAQRRVSGGAGLVFKGSGFYLTDYGKNAHRKSGSEAPASGESKTDAGGSSGGEGAKADSGSSAEGSSGSSSESSGGSKSEAPPPAKSDTAKSTENKPSGKSKGGGSSSGGGGDTK